MKSQYLNAEQLRDLVYNRLPGLEDSTTDEMALTLSPAQWGEAVDAVIASYIATLPAAPDKLIAELHLLEEVCAFYANDEDRYLVGDGEPFGSFPTEVGLKARSARERFNKREAEEAARMAALWPRKVGVEETAHIGEVSEVHATPRVLHGPSGSSEVENFYHIFGVVPVKVESHEVPQVDIWNFYVRATSLDKAHKVILRSYADVEGVTEFWGGGIWESSEVHLYQPHFKARTQRRPLEEHENWKREQEHYVLLQDGPFPETSFRA